jgi:hypothetical protein
MAIPDAIRWYGEMFRGLPAQEPVLPREPLLGPDGPLSAGLAEAANLRSFAAGDFARTKDKGLVAAGDGLVRISSDLTGFDRKGAAAIRELFPEGGR